MMNPVLVMRVRIFVVVPTFLLSRTSYLISVFRINNLFHRKGCYLRAKPYYYPFSALNTNFRLCGIRPRTYRVYYATSVSVLRLGHNLVLIREYRIGQAFLAPLPGTVTSVQAFG